MSKPDGQPEMTLENDPVLRSVPEIEGYKTLGPCVLYARLGAGGMGSVYRGQHLKLDIDVAVKVLRRELAIRDEFVHRFQREAKVAARLNSPYLVRVFDVDHEGELHYVIMEYVRGENARERLDRKQQLSETEVLEILLGSAQGLAAAHQGGVLHRDIKPDNILIGQDGTVKLADLGLAKAMQEGDTRFGDKDQFTTTIGSVVGTPAFMSPEQCKDLRDAVPASDVFSLGATLHYLLVGNPPFEASSEFGTMMKICSEDIPDPRAVRPDLSDAVCDLLKRMTDRTLNQRIQDGSELLEALLEIHRPVPHGLADKEAGKMRAAAAQVSKPPAAQTIARIRARLGGGGDSTDLPVTREMARPHDEAVPVTAIETSSGPSGRAPAPPSGAVTPIPTAAEAVAAVSAGSGRRKGWVIAVLALVLITGGVGGFFILQNNSEQARVERLDQFTARLEEALNEPNIDLARQRIAEARELAPGAAEEQLCDQALRDIEQEVKFHQMIALALAADDLLTAQGLLDDALELAVTERHRTLCEEKRAEFALRAYQAKVADAAAIAKRNPTLARDLYGEAREMAVTPEHVAHCTERIAALVEEGSRRSRYAEQYATARRSLAERALVAARQAIGVAGALALGDAEKSECQSLLDAIDARDHFEKELARAGSMLKTDPDRALDVLGELTHNKPGDEDRPRIEELMSAARKQQVFGEKWSAAHAAHDGGEMAAARALYGEAEQLAPSEGDGQRCRDAIAAIDQAAREAEARNDVGKDMGNGQRDVAQEGSGDAEDGGGTENPDADAVPSPGTLTIELADGTPLTLVWIEPGTYAMGSPDTEEGRDDDEHQHTVTTTRGFYLGRTEMTNLQFDVVVRGSSRADLAHLNHPKVDISRRDARLCCNRLTEYAREKGIGGEFRLPTEAEWEFAARAGATGTMPWPSEAEAPRMANLCDAAHEDAHPGRLVPFHWNDGHAEAAGVGSFEPNAWGLHDMIGNVWEWVADRYDASYYEDSPTEDPPGSEQGGRSGIVRGGAYNTPDAADCRFAKRSRRLTTNGDRMTGLRVVYVPANE